MDWIDYYTPRGITRKLLKRIPKDYTPTHIIDICGGSGNMLIEGSLKYPKAKVTYIDKSIDEVVKKNYKKSWRILQNDSTNTSTLKFFNSKEKKLLLANPPFGYTRKKVSKFKLVNRLEIQILDVNISLLNTGDIFAAVLPENIFSSENALDFRTYLKNNFDIIYQGKPKKYFNTSEVLTRLFVGRKIENRKSRLVEKNFISTNLLLERGIDNSLISTKSNKHNYEIKIVHRNKLDGGTDFYCNSQQYNNKPIIKKKDILIVRVGRNSGKVIYANKDILGHGVSDNLMLLRNHSILKRETRYLEQILIKSKKGLTTKYITKKDVFEAIRQIKKL